MALIGLVVRLLVAMTATLRSDYKARIARSEIFPDSLDLEIFRLGAFCQHRASCALQMLLDSVRVRCGCGGASSVTQPSQLSEISCHLVSSRAPIPMSPRDVSVTA